MTGAEEAWLVYTVIGLSATGTAISAYSAYEEGKDAARQARATAAWQSYNARVSKRNAEFLRRQAARDEEAGRKITAFEAKQQLRQRKQVMARQRALVGASGVEMEGSPLIVAQDTAGQLALEGANRLSRIEMENLRRKEAYGREIYGYESQSILDVSKASASKAAAWGYGRAATFGAGASILQGAAQTGYMGYRMRKT